MSTADAEAGAKASRLQDLAGNVADQPPFVDQGDADDLGPGPAAAGFCTQYFRHIEPQDVLDRDLDGLVGLIRSHLELGAHRERTQTKIKLWTPKQGVDGWQAPGEATTVQIVTADLPYLVDSVQMEILRQGWTIRELFHPQFTVRREGDRLTGFGEPVTSDAPSGWMAESWITVEVVPAPGEQPDDTTIEKLEAGLLRVLHDVAQVVADWPQMRAQALAASDEVASSITPHSQADRDTAVELMRWVAAQNFTLLGYAEYRLVRGDGGRSYEIVPGTGLGLLADESAADHRFGANPPTTELPQLIAVTKDNQVSTVHRPTYLDYIGVREFDQGGRVTGERRFLGLFAGTAYSESISRIPVLRVKAAEVMRLIGYDPNSHGGKAVTEVLNAYPRDELFQTRADVLAPMVERISHLRERRQVRMFERRDPYGRYLSAMVFLPRDRFTTQVRLRMQDILRRALGGERVEYEARVGESVLARLHFIVRMPPDRRLGSVDVPALEAELTQATRSWNDRLHDAVAASTTPVRRDEVEDVFPEGYKEDFSPRQAMLDVDALAQLSGADDMPMVVYTPEKSSDAADLRLKVFRTEPMPLSRVLPHLSQLGVDVIDERPFDVTLPGGRPAYILDFGLRVAGDRPAEQRRPYIDQVWTAADRQRFTEALTASYLGHSESDALNGLIVQAGLTWRQVSWLRAVSRYLQQAGSTNSQAYIAEALRSNPEVTVALTTLFATKFDPDLEIGLDDRRARAEELREEILADLDQVQSLDQDRILRSFLAVITATVRTNAFQEAPQALALKLLPRQIPGLPEPRPAFEIFVYSPRVEGVHLRFGPVARGGLRWSDRAEDFRTEILGLVKAQMVKNTVIVPVGAKGGFYGKRSSTDREARAAEGQACYQIFIASLLDVTDNLVDGEAVPPPRVVRFDADDAYLVVAADKGTATFSDLANAISVRRGFWMGDAFASGGSVGYDHKAMGITARGAWESVKRHFRELGITGEFSSVGVGDMAGDVFGNGMLLSEQNRLLAAFNHLHIFLDPNPDPARSFAERRRLFETPGTTWADYDPAVLSDGGGVYPRTAKSIPVNAAVRDALGIEDDVATLAPNDLIRRILTAPVDLFWNGGIGTYVKASTESHADVGDKANDAVRIDGAQLRARCVGEGGNLGLTQLGRVEYAQHGGRINTDFIDNSAGVDTSDHEVNIKILLSAEVAAGALAEPDRHSLLAEMTDDVAELVLAHNDDQNIALANASSQAPAMAPIHELWMSRLVDLGRLDRALEFLPDSDAMAARMADGQGLTDPELAVLLSYTKIWLQDEILASDLPDDPFLHDRLIRYFPGPLQQRYATQMDGHPLRREIITTTAVNRFVNSAGITACYRLSGESGAAPADVIRAQLASRSIFGAGGLELSLRRLDTHVPADLLTAYRLQLRTLVERGTRWLINNRRMPIDVQAVLDEFAEPVRRFHSALPELLGSREQAILAERRAEFVEQGFDPDLALAGAGLPFAQVGLPVAQVAGRQGCDILDAARVNFAVASALGLDAMMRRILQLPRRDRWQDLARGALRDDLQALMAQLTTDALAQAPQPVTGPDRVEAAVQAWRDRHPGAEAAADTIREVTVGEPDLAKMSVGLRTVRTMHEL